MEQITATDSFLDFVIEDTEAGILEWNCLSTEKLAIFSTNFQIKKTDKYLSFQLFVKGGEESYIMVHFWIHPQVVIPFEKIKYIKHKGKMEYLISKLYFQITKK
jgi:hypothetical protein